MKEKNIKKKIFKRRRMYLYIILRLIIKDNNRYKQFIVI